MSIDRGSADVERRFSQDSHRGQPHGGHAMLIDAMRERAVAESWTFTLLIPNEPRKGGAD